MAVDLTAILSLRVDFNFTDPCYVLKLASNGGGAQPGGTCQVAAALSNNVIKVYQQEGGDLRHSMDLAGHTDRITDVSMPVSATPQLVVSSSDDGTIKCWDGRSNASSESYTVQGEELTSCSCTENVVAAGGNGTLYFWDRRSRKLLQRLDDTHMDIVTIVQFHASRPGFCFTASDDGLIAAFDFTNGLNEDEAFVGAYNIQNSPAELAFYGAEDDKLWCRSASETMHFWDWARSIAESSAMAETDLPREAPPDTLDVFDARELLNAQLTGHTGAFQGQVDYVLGCHHVKSEGQLYVAAGSNQGSVALFPVGAPAFAGHMFGHPSARLCGGHSEVVRTALFNQGMVVTGGEDARLCLWADQATLEEQMVRVNSGSVGAVRTTSASPARHTPY